MIPRLEELYGVEKGSITAEKMTAAFQKLDFDYFATDATTQEISVEEAVKIIETADKPVVLASSFAVRYFVKEFFPSMENRIQWYTSAQRIFGDNIREFCTQESIKRIKNVNATNANEFDAERAETEDVDYVMNARELYRFFLRAGGAPAKKHPLSLDESTTSQLPYEMILDEKCWTLSLEPEEHSVIVNGTSKRVIVANTLGQCRRLLELVTQGTASWDIIKLNA